MVNAGLHVLTGPDSVTVRASASGAGGRAFDLGTRHPKYVKMVPVAALLGAQNSWGKHWLLFSQKIKKKKRKKIISMMGIQ